MSDNIKIQNFTATLKDPTGNSLKYRCGMELLHTQNSRVSRNHSLFDKRWSTTIREKSTRLGENSEVFPNGVKYERDINFGTLKENANNPNMNEELLSLDFKTYPIDSESTTEVISISKKKGKIKIKDSKFPPPDVVEIGLLETEQKEVIISHMELNKIEEENKNVYLLSVRLIGIGNCAIEEVVNTAPDGKNQKVIAILKKSSSVMGKRIDFDDFDDNTVAFFVVPKLKEDGSINESIKQGLLRFEN